MRKGRATAPNPWDEAVRRATAVAKRTRAGGMDESCWDDVAIRDIIAIVLFALHLRDGSRGEQVKWESVLWHLRDDQSVRALVEESLPSAGHQLRPDPEREADTDRDPVEERWRWLTRTWDPQAPIHTRTLDPSSPWYRPLTPGPDGTVPEPRWGGMTRGVGDGLPDPAIEVCTSWAAHAIQEVLSAECGGYERHQRVRITRGPFKGKCGYVRELGWVFDDDAREVWGPAGYVVDLDDAEGTERFDADDVTKRADGLRWAHRAAGTLKYDDPRSGWRVPASRSRSCAEDLDGVLARVANPEIVPSALRDTIAAAYEHHHMDMGSGATAEPHRISWQLSLHWYQVTEQYVEGRVAELWEVEFKSRLRDPAPVRYVALSELEARALVTQRTESM